MHSCLDKWAGTDVDRRHAIRWEGEEGATGTLTYAELRSFYSLGYLRAIIHVILVASFLFGSISALLRANKALALTGIGLTLAGDQSLRILVSVPLGSCGLPSAVS